MYVEITCEYLLIYQLKYFGMSLRGFHMKQGLYKLRSKNDFFLFVNISDSQRIFFIPFDEQI